MQRRQGLGLQVRNAIDPTPTEPIMLDILPHPLVRVQLRRIARQEKQPQPPVGGLSELPDRVGAVHRMTIEDEKHRPRRIVQQPAAEIDEHTPVQVAVVDRKPQPTPGGHRGDQVDREPVAGGRHHRGLPDRRPGGPGMVVGAHPGLVGEPDRGAHLLGFSADLGVVLDLPASHRLGVLLVGAVQRPLRRQAELAEQPADADRRQPYTEFSADEVADHVTGPQGKRKPQLAGVVADDQRVEPLQLGAGEFWWASGSIWRTAQMRSCSRVLWSSLRPSLSRMRESNQITTTKSTYLGSAWYLLR